MTIDKNRLKALALAATPGPWVFGGTWVSRRGDKTSIADCRRGDERYIAAANPATILVLLEEIERLEDRVSADQDRVMATIGQYAPIQAERDQLMAAIATPEAVFINIKAGKIPRPSLRSMIDLYGEVVNGDEAQLLEIAKLRDTCDILQNQVRVLQSDANSWQSGYDEGRRMGTKPNLEEIKSLRAKLELVTAERDARMRQAEVNLDEGIEFRADAERFRFVLRSPDDTFGTNPKGIYFIEEDGRGFGELLESDSVRGVIDAAMVKESSAAAAVAERRLAPLKDFEGNAIHEGDRIRHPCGTTGTVLFAAEHRNDNKWRVQYDKDKEGDTFYLGLQVGDRGMAVVVKEVSRD